MSWGTSTVGAVPKDGITPDPPAPADAVAAEQTEQYDAAVQAATALARIVGRPEDEVYVSLTGHANPDHAPRAGWADEMISVTVSARPTHR